MNRRCTDEFTTRGSGIDLAGATSPLGMCGEQTDEFASEYLQTLATIYVCLSVGSMNMNHEHDGNGMVKDGQYDDLSIKDLILTISS